MIGSIAKLGGIVGATSSASGTGSAAGSTASPTGTISSASGVGSALGPIKSSIGDFLSIYSMLNPDAFAKRMGKADSAYFSSAYPGTNPWEHLGTSGIQSALESASISGRASERSAGLSTAPAHREQERRDRMFNSNKRHLDSQTSKILEEVRKIAAETQSELWRAKYAALREMVVAQPNSFWSGVYSEVQSIRNTMNELFRSVRDSRTIDEIRNVFIDFKDLMNDNVNNELREYEFIRESD